MLFTDRRAETRTEKVDWPVFGPERGEDSRGRGPKGEGRRMPFGALCRGRGCRMPFGALCRGRDVDCLCGSSRGMGREGDGQLGE